MGVRDRSNELKKKWVAAAFRLRFGDPVPSVPHPLAAQIIPPTEGGPDISQFLRNAFAQRPCWFKRNLVEKCTAWFRSTQGVRLGVNAVAAAVANFLPTIAFTYLGGPWMGLWVRFGFNPQEDPEGFMMQVIALKISKREYHEATSR
jgi:general transcription factor 3C polypeptide 5 (transcription factor C subunit 1)